MADSFVKKYKYTKGIYDANFYNTQNRDLLYHDEKLTDANITSSVNMGEILAGLGNVPQIMIFDTAKFNITLTAADVELRAYQLQTGGTLSYNGITQTCEIIPANSAALAVNGTPVAPYGYSSPVAYVNGDGTAYAIDPDTKTVQGFVATPGTQYSVRYYIAKPASEVLDVKSLFTPEIVTAEIKMPVYQAATGSSALHGSICGYLWSIAPRYQFNGEASITANQTANATTSLSGQALAYDAVDLGDCAASGLSSLIYVVWEPISSTEGVTDMVVLNGGVVEVAAGADATIPVKFVMADGQLSNPDLADLTYTSSAQGTATVSNGIVTGVTEGDCEVTIANANPALTCVCNVSVTAT